jgi:hypothetical protein
MQTASCLESKGQQEDFFASNLNSASLTATQLFQIFVSSILNT